MNTTPDRSGGASPLDQIVDDTDPREKSVDWSVSEIREGRSPEEVAADLVASGWTQDAADDIAEEARKRLRDTRAPTPQEQVRRRFGAGDPNVVKNSMKWRRGLLGAAGGALGAILRLRSSK